MNLALDSSMAYKYKNGSQVARVLTEAWARDNMYCPHCLNESISPFERNRPVADFFCPHCRNEYELKSKNGKIGHIIPDGAYKRMMERIDEPSSPDLILMTYKRRELRVENVIFVPKHFLTPFAIQKRPPLGKNARRAGWVGCNILMDKIPSQGRINIILNGTEEDRELIAKKVELSSRLVLNDVGARGWLMSVLLCINRIEHEEFELNDVYAFEKELCDKYPENRNIRPKIRQQLQVLRDRGVIEFAGRGVYRKKHI